MIGSAVTTANTAFLLPSTVFVGGSSNPAPNQQSGGIWVLGVGGAVNTKTSGSTIVAASANAAVPPNSSGTVTCSQKVEEKFAGLQIGSDIARLNMNEWSLHLGATAGFLGSNSNLAGGAFAYTDPSTSLPAGGGPFTSVTQVPFAGLYVAATKGGLFIDGVLRSQYYQSSMSAPGANLFGQNIDAHGYSFSGGIEYYWQVNPEWVIEPSAGIIISRVKVDPFNFISAGSAGPLNTPPHTPFDDRLSGTLYLNQIDSDIGHVGLQFGRTIQAGNVLWEPFAAISVWHEFGPNLTSSYTTCPLCVFDAGVPTTISATSSTSTFGTFGQYSLGVFVSLQQTGWLGFARVDLRDGPNLQGLSGIGGVRYQFTPEAATTRVMPVKAPVREALPAVTVDWTGFYVGGLGGATFGTADWKYPGGEASPHIAGYDWGGDLGYNFQHGRWVFGVEADMEKTNLAGGNACGPLIKTPNGAPPPTSLHGPMFQLTCDAAASWIATAAARVGYTWDRALLYFRGGGAWTDERFAATCNSNDPAQPCTNTTPVPGGGGFTHITGLGASTNAVGWIIGIGAEFALTREWSARAEWDYVGFGDRNLAASDGTALNAGVHVSEVNIGVNYRFNPGSVVEIQ
jgi:opacity protein-like surface antigen